jgi:DNA-binding NtrC family response regulator
MRSLLSPSVLIVDDESDIVNTLVPHLQASGFIVYPFTDPRLALEHFEKSPDKFKLLISDSRMPGMSGMELIQNAKKLCPKLKAIMITAFDINPITLKKLKEKIGVDHIANKPISPRELAEIAQRLTTVNRE